MEEAAKQLNEEGIHKTVTSPGRGQLSAFPDGTKVDDLIVSYFIPINVNKTRSLIIYGRVVELLALRLTSTLRLI